MKKTNLLLTIASIMILLSCNRTNFSNPEDVLKNYFSLSHKNKNEILYENFLSSRSKEFVTKDEFIKAKSISDSNLNHINFLETNISTYPIDVNYPTYRRFKVEEKQVYKKDTIYFRDYFSLINEDGKWKVIWTSTLLSFAWQKYYDGNYSEARKTYEKIIELDPFNGNAYDQLAWSFNRDNSLTKNERENGIVKNAKYAVTLEEDNPNHYNTLALYYSNIGNLDLAIENYERGLKFCQNNYDKTKFYNNLAGSYIDTRKYDKAEIFIKKSIEIDDRAFVWFQYGCLMQEQFKITKAIECFENSLKKDKMENSLQSMLYYHYAYCCFSERKCETAKEYINKALDIDPNNYTYQNLFNQLKYCN